MTYLRSAVNSMYSLLVKQPLRPDDLIKAATIGCKTLDKLLNDEDFKEHMENLKDFGATTRKDNTWKTNLVKEFPDFLEEINKLMVSQKIPLEIVEVVCQQAREMQQPIIEKHCDPATLLKMIEQVRYDLCGLQHDIKENKNDRAYLYDASDKMLRCIYTIAVLTCFTATAMLSPDINTFTINVASVLASTYFSLAIQSPSTSANNTNQQAKRTHRRRVTISIILSILLILITISIIIFPYIKTFLPPKNSQTLFFSNIKASFYTNSSSNNGTFDKTPSSVPVFTQSFPVIAFNPDPGVQHCSSSTGVNTETRPFTDVFRNPDGTCKTIPVQDVRGQMAGVGNLKSFEAVFVTSINIPAKGFLTMLIRGDDGWIISIGANKYGGQQPYPEQTDIMTNPPAASKSPIYSYPEMGDNNLPSSPSLYKIRVDFPDAGNYPVEIDYTECCGSELTLVVSNVFTPESS